MNQDEKSFEDLLNQAEVKDWLHRAEREMMPQMKNCRLSLVIGTDKPDAKLALEVGAAVLFDKPLLIVVESGTRLPDGLRKIATKIVEVDKFMSPQTTAKIHAAITEMLKDRPA